MKDSEISRESSSNRTPSPSSPDDHHSSLLDYYPVKRVLTRTGTTWTAVAHIIAGVIGSGVLSLAWSTAQLGWIAGPCLIVAFAVLTLIPAFLLCDCFMYPDPSRGPNRIGSYMEAVRIYMGDWNHKVCGAFLHENYFGNGVAYTITSASSMKAILLSNCYHREGVDANCTYGYTSFMLLFGGLQIVVSQIPNFHHMEWLSWVAAIMSFTYSSIGIGLGIATVVENGKLEGSITGISTDIGSDKLWLIFESFGEIAFAYSFAIILVEIQDTLKSPPPENENMKKASWIAVLVISFFYLLCGCSGYAAFGDDTPGNLLSGFGFYEPYWLVDFANACIVLHLVGGYQIYSQPVFSCVEDWAKMSFPQSGFVNKVHRIKMARLPVQVNLFRLVFRTGYVILSTTIAVTFPYFNEVVGLLGAINFWPLTIYYPVEMYCARKGLRPWSGECFALRVFSLLCLVIAVVGLLGSVQGLILDEKSTVGIRLFRQAAAGDPNGFIIT